MFFLIGDQAEAYLLRVSLYIDEQIHERRRRECGNYFILFNNAILD